MDEAIQPNQDPVTSPTIKPYPLVDKTVIKYSYRGQYAGEFLMLQMP